jgi:RNA polymerase sigma factor (sigma-70 family)
MTASATKSSAGRGGWRRAADLHTVRKHDEEHPHAAVFPAAPEELAEAERTRVVKLYRRGVPIAKLARRTCRPRATIYRLVLEERIAKLNRRKAKFIDDSLYHQDDADDAIEAIAAPSMLDDASPQGEASRVPRDLPPYLADLYRTPLLSPARERGLFLKFNFRKMQFAQARRKLDPQFARTRDINVLEGLWRRVTETKNEIVRANLRLVVSIARKHLRPGLSLMELISEGNLTLMRAVESFDTHRGHRFSTYATLALMKGFARSIPQMLSDRAAGAPADQRLLDVPDRRPTLATDRFIDREAVRDMLQRLDDRERRVLRAYYGLDEAAPATYEQVGERLGISKQRVRQIEQTALAKLRSGARQD